MKKLVIAFLKDDNNFLEVILGLKEFHYKSTLNFNRIQKYIRLKSNLIQFVRCSGIMMLTDGFGY